MTEHELVKHMQETEFHLAAHDRQLEILNDRIDLLKKLCEQYDKLLAEKIIKPSYN